MKNFMDCIANELNTSMTENGAIGYKTTGKALLDLNYQVPSLRGVSEEEIGHLFLKAFNETPLLALKWLFFMRDIRGGLGERRTFRAILKTLAHEHPDVINKVLHLVSEYGRWDDLFVLLTDDTFPKAVKSEAMNIIVAQLKSDIYNYKNGNSYSLLAKWLPSINSSNQEDKRLAAYIASYIHYKYKQYRKMVSALRKGLKIVEIDMSANNWSNIDYEAVPSRANLLYSNAFMRHDKKRRTEFINSVMSGEKTLHAGVLYPYEIIHRYNPWSYCSTNPSIEAMWKNLPNYVTENNSTLVVCDGSGSMTSKLPNSDVMAIEVSRSLAIYFAEKLSGPYKDKFITFSNHPEFVDLSSCISLAEKYNEAKRYDDYTNTDIKKVFDIILDTALKNHLTQDELPKNILIISDMEFDGAFDSKYFTDDAKARLFAIIKNKYARYGYKLPRLIFWNVDSRTNTIPVVENDLGVALVSGFSPSIAKMVLSGELDPWKCLVDMLNSKRYDLVNKAFAFI